jgi:hypothetical protein
MSNIDIKAASDTQTAVKEVMKIIRYNPYFFQADNALLLLFNREKHGINKAIRLYCIPKKFRTREIN